MSCPVTGIRDFPVITDITPTDNLNRSIQESFLIDFQWATRSVQPRFVAGAAGRLCFLDEGNVYSSLPNQTTLRLQGVSFTLRSVQFVAAQHASFVLPRGQTLLGEIVLTFSNSLAASENYVAICVPVLSRSGAQTPAYLKALQEKRLDGKPLSLVSLLPASAGRPVEGPASAGASAQNDFISYSTCLTQLKASQTTTTTLRAFVFLRGIACDPTVWSQILENRTLPTTATFPEGVRAQTGNSRFRIQTEPDYRQFLRYGLLASSGAGAAASQTIRTDTTSAYKCVPLNPATHIRDGKIKINTASAEPLSQLLEKERLNLQGAETPKSGLTPGQVENAIAIAIGTAFGILALTLIAYLISRWVGAGFTGPLFQTPDWFWKLAPLTTIGILSLAIGFVVGALVITYA